MDSLKIKKINLSYFLDWILPNAYRISLSLSAGRARMAQFPFSTMGHWVRSGC